MNYRQTGRTTDHGARHSAQIGRQAIVIGAGIAGMAAAGALAGCFERVTLLERDGLADGVAPRARDGEGHDPRGGTTASGDLGSHGLRSRRRSLP